MADDTISRNDRQRLDKWLWFARFARTRTLAQKLAISGKVRINRVKIASASRAVKVGDTLTIAFDSGICVLRIINAGTRRGPAAEARLLFEDLCSPAPTPGRPARPAAPRPPGSGRPTKRNRRAMEAFRQASGEDFPPRNV